MKRLQAVADAMDALISPDPLRREFFGHERLVVTLYGAVKPDPAALEFLGRVACLMAIADAIRAKLHPGTVDVSHVIKSIDDLLDVTITGVDLPDTEALVIDLSKIDFDRCETALRNRNTRTPTLKF